MTWRFAGLRSGHRSFAAGEGSNESIVQTSSAHFVANWLEILQLWQWNHRCLAKAEVRHLVWVSYYTGARGERTLCQLMCYCSRSRATSRRPCQWKVTLDEVMSSDFFWKESVVSCALCSRQTYRDDVLSGCGEDDFPHHLQGEALCGDKKGMFLFVMIATYDGGAVPLLIHSESLIIWHSERTSMGCTSGAQSNVRCHLGRWSQVCSLRLALFWALSTVHFGMQWGKLCGMFQWDSNREHIPLWQALPLTAPCTCLPYP